MREKKERVRGTYAGSEKKRKKDGPNFEMIDSHKVNFLVLSFMNEFYSERCFYE